jgi:hypothetical protein
VDQLLHPAEHAERRASMGMVPTPPGMAGAPSLQEIEPVGASATLKRHRTRNYAKRCGEFSEMTRILDLSHNCVAINSCIIAPAQAPRSTSALSRMKEVKNRRLAHKIVQMAERVSVNPH